MQAGTGGPTPCRSPFTSPHSSPCCCSPAQSHPGFPEAAPPSLRAAEQEPWPPAQPAPPKAMAGGKTRGGKGGKQRCRGAGASRGTRLAAPRCTALHGAARHGTIQPNITRQQQRCAPAPQPVSAATPVQRVEEQWAAAPPPRLCRRRTAAAPSLHQEQPASDSRKCNKKMQHVRC